MTASIDLVLFDIGGVLGSNGWDHEQRAAAVEHFDLDAADFQYRHEETVGALEAGQISLDEYLDVTVFCARRTFSRDAFKTFMFAQSVAWPDSIEIAHALAQSHAVRLATLNNESAELNVHRIDAFGLCDIFPTFFSSCWLGVRKPTQTDLSAGAGHDAGRTGANAVRRRPAAESGARRRAGNADDSFSIAGAVARRAAGAGASRMTHANVRARANSFTSHDTCN